MCLKICLRQRSSLHRLNILLALNVLTFFNGLTLIKCCQSERNKARTMFSKILSLTGFVMTFLLLCFVCAVKITTRFCQFFYIKEYVIGMKAKYFALGMLRSYCQLLSQRLNILIVDHFIWSVSEAAVTEELSPSLNPRYTSALILGVPQLQIRGQNGLFSH